MSLGQNISGQLYGKSQTQNRDDITHPTLTKLARKTDNKIIELVNANNNLKNTVIKELKLQPKDNKNCNKFVKIGDILGLFSNFPNWARVIHTKLGLKDKYINDLPNFEYILDCCVKGDIDSLVVHQDQSEVFWLALFDEQKRTPLHLAIENNKLQLALWLAKICPALMYTRDCEKRLPLELTSDEDLIHNVMNVIFPQKSINDVENFCIRLNYFFKMQKCEFGSIYFNKIFNQSNNKFHLLAGICKYLWNQPKSENFFETSVSFRKDKKYLKEIIKLIKSIRTLNQRQFQIYEILNLCIIFLLSRSTSLIDNNINQSELNKSLQIVFNSNLTQQNKIPNWLLPDEFLTVFEDHPLVQKIPELLNKSTKEVLLHILINQEYSYERFCELLQIPIKIDPTHLPCLSTLLLLWENAPNNPFTKKIFNSLKNVKGIDFYSQILLPLLTYLNYEDSEESKKLLSNLIISFLDKSTNHTKKIFFLDKLKSKYYDRYQPLFLEILNTLGNKDLLNYSINYITSQELANVMFTNSIEVYIKGIPENKLDFNFVSEFIESFLKKTRFININSFLKILNCFKSKKIFNFQIALLYVDKLIKYFYQEFKHALVSNPVDSTKFNSLYDNSSALNKIICELIIGDYNQEIHNFLINLILTFHSKGISFDNAYIDKRVSNFCSISCKDAFLLISDNNINNLAIQNDNTLSLDQIKEIFKLRSLNVSPIVANHLVEQVKSLVLKDKKSKCLRTTFLSDFIKFLLNIDIEDDRGDACIVDFLTFVNNHNAKFFKRVKEISILEINFPKEKLSSVEQQRLLIDRLEKLISFGINVNNDTIPIRSQFIFENYIDPLHQDNFEIIQWWIFKLNKSIETEKNKNAPSKLFINKNSTKKYKELLKNQFQKDGEFIIINKRGKYLYKTENNEYLIKIHSYRGCVQVYFNNYKEPLFEGYFSNNYIKNNVLQLCKNMSLSEQKAFYKTNQGLNKIASKYQKFLVPEAWLNQPNFINDEHVVLINYPEQAKLKLYWRELENSKLISQEFFYSSYNFMVALDNKINMIRNMMNKRLDDYTSYFGSKIFLRENAYFAFEHTNPGISFRIRFDSSQMYIKIIFHTLYGNDENGVSVQIKDDKGERRCKHWVFILRGLKDPKKVNKFIKAKKKCLLKDKESAKLLQDNKGVLVSFNSLFVNCLKKVTTLLKVSSYSTVAQNAHNEHLLLTQLDQITQKDLWSIGVCDKEKESALKIFHIICKNINGFKLNPKIKSKSFNTLTNLIHKAPSNIDLNVLIKYFLDFLKSKDFILSLKQKRINSPKNLLENLKSFIGSLKNGTGLTGLSDDDQKDYNILRIQLSHTLQKLDQDNNINSLQSLVLELAITARFCAPKLSEVIQSHYLGAFGLFEKSINENSTELTSLLHQHYGHAIHSTIETLLNNIRGNSSSRQTVHVLNYLRSKLQEKGYELPLDPRVTNIQDKYKENYGKSDFPATSLSNIFNSILIPTLFKRIYDYQIQELKDISNNKSKGNGINLLVKALKEIVRQRPDKYLSDEDQMSYMMALSFRDNELQTLRTKKTQIEDMLNDLKPNNFDWKNFEKTKDSIKVVEDKITNLSAKSLRLLREVKDIESQLDQSPSNIEKSSKRKRSYAQITPISSSDEQLIKILTQRKIFLVNQEKEHHTKIKKLKLKRMRLDKAKNALLNTSLSEIHQLMTESKKIEIEIEERAKYHFTECDSLLEKACEKSKFIQYDDILYLGSLTIEGIHVVLEFHEYITPTQELVKQRSMYKEKKDEFVS